MAERSDEEERNRFEKKVYRLDNTLQEFYFRLAVEDQGEVIRHSKKILKLNIRELSDLGSIELAIVMCRHFMGKKVDKMLLEVPKCKRAQASRVLDWSK